MSSTYWLWMLFFCHSFFIYVQNIFRVKNFIDNSFRLIAKINSEIKCYRIKITDDQQQNKTKTNHQISHLIDFKPSLYTTELIKS